ncbi:glucuronate isomerase [Flavobacterium akiainvivens]|uniref:Uronate isomerase n=1 Tax=Flavobacterium akiainvivens TaxID=1202724 RepID=A0A0M8MHE3_9FLAO|nr:glucuronate isomerase [Flavobacterium akiainvivens]KOS05648.1 glucuronate isomerase [Flavobacterium akiainvivens]SFQ35997.1 D-glucuronate isomerase [Flavobacterium akiainvivens]
MAKPFITETFLLQNKFAEELYFKYAEKQPIIDYHNHLPPAEIAADRKFENISQLWISGDHYKWRAMRTLGINEKYITGNAPDEEKFAAWAKTVPHTLRNPLFHWTQLELKRYFDVDDYLNEASAKDIYANINSKLQQSGYSVQGLLTKMNVEMLCTTEDPIDTLEHHKTLGNGNFGTKVNTAFRPDKAVLIENDTYNDYLAQLEKASGTVINTYNDLKDALLKRLDFFHENGCRISDLGFNQLPFETFTDAEVTAIFEKRRHGGALTVVEADKFKTALLLFLCEEYATRGWVQQFHLGAMRNNNARMHRILGPDTGWDSIGDYMQATTLSRFLDALDSKDKLAKTILYNLNPADNELFATMVGNFNDGSHRGKVQYGSGWWFLDQKDGMIKQLNALSNMGLLSCFVGMLTDSRSFMSFPRHEYFRRVLCNLLGQEMQTGELPQDIEWVGNMVADICYRNASQYFEY